MYNRIRYLREDNDLNQTKVAEMLGMSQTGYSKNETGENEIPTSVLIRLARFYKSKHKKNKFNQLRCMDDAGLNYFHYFRFLLNNISSYCHLIFYNHRLYYTKKIEH